MMQERYKGQDQEHHRRWKSLHNAGMELENLHEIYQSERTSDVASRSLGRDFSKMELGSIQGEQPFDLPRNKLLSKHGSKVSILPAAG